MYPKKAYPVHSTMDNDPAGEASQVDVAIEHS
jgi:hypothetical protein